MLKLLTLFECCSDTANSRGTVRTTQSPNEGNSRISYYCTLNKFRGLIFCVFDWQENLWGITDYFWSNGGVVGTIIVRFAKYASYCGFIFVDRGIPRNPQNLYTLKISTHTVTLGYIATSYRRIRFL